ncbi:uncharacterized protein LOC116619775 [Nematostella vectensis]|uniref:uncharacterized protein LOC116619775 n=1 Tax=Nematostella vectensis TaxID=45351 RepID=UPI0020775339|nr:uncharacterized protein LOC116619775 [Nematostella vectensis]
MESGKIKDSQITVTSLLPNTSAHMARLHSTPGWVPLTLLKHISSTLLMSQNYVQLDLRMIREVHMAVLSGVPKDNTIPSSAPKISVSKNGFSWKLREKSQKTELFQGTSPDYVNVAIVMKTIARGRYIRVLLPPYRPLSSSEYNYSLEVYACNAKTSHGGEPSAIGVSSRAAVPDPQFTSPSILDAMHGPEHARLDTSDAGGGWCALTCDPSVFLQIDLAKTWQIVEIETQGLHGTTGVFRGINSYSLSTSLDGVAWIQFSQNGNTKIFLGNFVENLSTKHKLLKPLTAKYVRFEPRTCSQRACMRVELYGHVDGETETPSVWLRSMLLKKSTNEMFVCKAETPRQKPHCLYSKDGGTGWNPIFPKVINIIAYDPREQILYGLSFQQKYMRSKDNGVKWTSLPNRKWKVTRDSPSLIIGLEIPFVPLTKQTYTVLEPLVQLTSNAGDIWTANQLGVYHAASGGTPSLVLSFEPYAEGLTLDICLVACVHGRCEKKPKAGFLCHCKPGYQGKSCTEAIDYCATAGYPCVNGATCTNKPWHYTCECVQPYMGSNCEVYNFCHNDPCVNGGTCTNLASNYSCACVTHYYGPNCELSPCTTFPCLNGGTCIVGGSGYSCICARYTGGDNCQNGLLLALRITARHSTETFVYTPGKYDKIAFTPTSDVIIQSLCTYGALGAPSFYQNLTTRLRIPETDNVLRMTNSIQHMQDSIFACPWFDPPFHAVAGTSYIGEALAHNNFVIAKGILGLPSQTYSYSDGSKSATINYATVSAAEFADSSGGDVNEGGIAGFQISLYT